MEKNLKIISSSKPKVAEKLLEDETQRFSQEVYDLLETNQGICSLHSQSFYRNQFVRRISVYRLLIKFLALPHPTQNDIETDKTEQGQGKNEMREEYSFNIVDIYAFLYFVGEWTL